jgi:hydroxymethylpyrimidine pyrophosphatase-like HAD family hydrolase
VQIPNKSTASNYAIFSDLTGTLVRQHAHGFPSSRRLLVRKLIEGGCFFCVITNDTFEAVHEFFITPLGTLTSPYFVISGGGYVGHQVDGQEVTEFFQGRGIAVEIRSAIGARIKSILESRFKKSLILPPIKDISAERTSIAALNPSFGPLSYFESTPSKVAVFFLDNPVATETQQSLFDAIESDDQIKELIKTQGLYLTRGANYLDITSCVKSDGLSALYASPLPSRFNLTERNITVLGDSLNDKDMLLYKFQTSKQINRIFLGEHRELADQIRQTFPQEFLFLESQYVDGAETILSQLVEGANL